jgi:putative chitinase
LTACEYWNSKNLSTFADMDDVTTITRKINGGLNGLDDRKQYLAKAKRAIPPDIFHNQPEPVVHQELDPQMTLDFNAPMPQPINVVVAKNGDNSPYVKDLQNMLIKKGAKITADGAYGPSTEKTVKAFQKKNNLEITGMIDTNTLNKLMSV